MATVAFHKTKSILLSKAHLPYRLLFIFLILSAFILWLVFYCLSPYWYSRDMVHQLSQNDLALAEQAIPQHLLQPYQADLMTLQSFDAQQWQGPGAKYLKQVWPKVAAQQNLHQLLLLHFNSAPPDSIKRAYSRFPSRFRLTLGNTPENTLWLEWQRESWNNWALSKLCIYNPQPVSEVKNCLSSSR